MNAGAIDERIHQLVTAHRGELEQLVDQALERELAQLVEERIAVRNGNGAADLVAPGSINSPRENELEPPASKVCRVCGVEKPAAAFDPYRRQCRSCRSARARERQPPPADGDDGPRPGP